VKKNTKNKKEGFVGTALWVSLPGLEGKSHVFFQFFKSL